MISSNYGEGGTIIDWIRDMGEAIDYIEDNLTNEIEAEEAAKRLNVSAFYFQKAFALLCGCTFGEYVRNRRLTLAGGELVASDARIIDIAVKYGYDSPDSFTKAFTRFHGSTPLAVRKEGKTVKSYAPLKIKLTLEGGNIMEYRIMEKEAFSVVGVARRFSFETCTKTIPEFWTEFCKMDASKKICAMYGICLDEDDKAKDFEYLIADDYSPWKEIPEGCVTRSFEKQSWAVFPCRGAMPNALQSTNAKIFSEWIPNCKDYELTSNVTVELYSDPSDFPKGNQDENYYTEIWIPVKKK